MRGANRALIAIGSVLVALVVLGLIVGSIQDAQFKPVVGQTPDRALGPVQVVLLAVGALLVLVGVIQHQGDRRRSGRD